MQFEVAPDPDTPEITGDGVQYDGYRFRAECRLAGKVYGARFGVDIAFGGVLSGDVEEITTDDLLGFAGIAPPRLRLVPIETHLAETRLPVRGVRSYGSDEQRPRVPDAAYTRRDASRFIGDRPPLSPEERAYLAIHRRRLEFVVELFRGLPLPAPRPRVLDVGPHFLTDLLRERTDAVVDQLGFQDERLSHPRPGEQHYHCDLSEAGRSGAWPTIPPHDVVVLCEVIEHLHVPPSSVLPFLASCLVRGGFLILQTPNAVALKRRAVMLLGRNPYELLRDTPANPGHVREYTRDEIFAYARAAGLELIRFESAAYFDYSGFGSALARWYGRLDALLPAGLRDGMTFVFRRTPEGSWR